jgi:single-strand DNA-binding protein
MNKCILTGRITKDLELRYTNNNKPVCNFTIAVNERATEEVDFIYCEVWNKKAENLVNYQSKGNLIAVMGKIKERSYDDKDGNKKYKTYVLVDDIEYLEKKNTDAVANNTIEVNQFEDVGLSIDEDDIPF